MEHAPERNSGPEPLRLLWLIDSLTVGGAESLAVSFARAARRRNIQLTVCARTTVDGNALEGELRAAGVAFENLRARNLRDVQAFRRLLALIRERRIDLVHAHLTYANIWGVVAGRVTGVPAIATLHVAPPRNAGLREAVRQRILRVSLNRLAKRIIVVSNALANVYASAGYSPAKLAVVHNGIETAVVRSGAASRESLGIPHRDFLVAAMAVLRPGKGIDVLLDSIAHLGTRVPSLRLLIIGDGPERAALVERSRRLGIDDRVTWAGFRRDTGALLAASDLFVHPTLADAFPTAVLEAMAAGRAVVASRVGGVPEIVVNGTSGMLVEPADAPALAGAIEYAARDIAWRTSAGEAGRARVESSFSIDAWVDRLSAIYADVAGRRKEAAS